MPQFPVLQPDGKLAVWSTIVDHFIALDCTEQDAVKVLSRRYSDTASVRDGVARCARGELVNPWWMRWDRCVVWAIVQHGLDDETVHKALKLTPEADQQAIKSAARIMADVQEAQP